MRWLKNWFRLHPSASLTSSPSLGQSRVSRKKRRVGFQPQVEQLEEKVLLSVVFTRLRGSLPARPWHHGPVERHRGPPASGLRPRNFGTPTA